MAEETPNTQYSHMGYGDRGERFSFRTASVEVDFLLHHLKPEMRVLDCGCGSGSITLGLAEAVSQGEVVGIDIGEAPIKYAREVAKEKGVSNAIFEVASVYEIPFEDESFEAVLSNKVLEHLQDPADGLKEMYRVLKPGGVIGISDNDVDGILMAPKDDPIQDMFNLWFRVWEYNGGNPRIGKHLRGMLHEAGFKHVQGMSRTRFGGTEDEIALVGNQFAIGVISNALDTAIKLGWADSGAKDRVTDQWAEFAAKPNAFFSFGDYQAIGWKE